MFDVNAQDGSVRRKRYESPIPSTPAPKPVRPAALDAQKMQFMHARLLDLYTREIDRQAENRAEMARDQDFYDNDQWREEDKAVLRARGQVPLVYNVIAASIDWVLGTEKRARTDFKVLPRRKEMSKPAAAKSALLKYLSDVNRATFHESRAFEDATKVGLGWIEDGVQDEDEDEPIYTRYESWRNLLHDSAATEMDLSDARFIFRTRWVDLDIACAMFPRRKPLLERSAGAAEDLVGSDLYGDEAMDAQETELDQTGPSRASDVVHGYHRRRVRLIEAWIRVPVETATMAGGEFRGELFDQFSPAHREEIEGGAAEVRRKVRLRMHVAIMTTAGMLWYSESPYRHNRFPFTPIWAYRRGRDGLPYGMIRRLRDIQEDINKRASKALHILSSNKIIMDQDALPDGVKLEEFAEEASRPDAILLKRPGKVIELNADRELSQWHLELMSRSIAMIQQSSGVTDENLGRRTNAVSGVAIGRRQDQGAMATAGLFDNLRLAKQVRGEKQLSLCEQFVTEEKQFRITSMRGTPEFVTVNDGLPENDIVRSKADYVISEAEWRATLRQAAVEVLLEAMQRLPPQVALVFLDLVVENMDLPNRDELVKRIRQISGMRDPEQEEPSPEEIAQQQAQEAAARLQQALAEAELAKKQAEAIRATVEAKKAAASTVDVNVSAMQKALAAAREALALPPSTHVADVIMHEAGFTARTDMEAAVAGSAGMAPPPPSPEQIAAQPGLMPRRMAA